MSKTYIQEKLIGTPGQVVSFDSNNKAILKTLVPEIGARLYVTAPVGSVISATDGISTITVTNEDQQFIPKNSDSLTTADSKLFYSNSGNLFIIDIPRVGSWLITATLLGVTSSKMISINGSGNYYVTLSYFEAYISVTFPTGYTCLCTDGTTTLTSTNMDGYYVFELPNTGIWSLYAYSELGAASGSVHITASGQQVSITLDPILTTLNDNSWEIIQSVARLSEGALYWSIGDCKEVALTGHIDSVSFLSSNMYVFIIGFDHNSEIEGLGIHFQAAKTISNQINVAFIDSQYGNNPSKTGSYKYFRMEASSGYGGWKESIMRNYILGTIDNQYSNSFINTLPTNLRSVLKPIIKYTDNYGYRENSASYVTATLDYIFLLSEYELFGSRVCANSAESSYQDQYQYYVNNSKQKYKHDNTSTAAIYWLRSPYVLNNAEGEFIYCGSDGTSRGHAVGGYSYGVAPCFVVG